MRILFSVLLIFGVFANTWAEQNSVTDTSSNTATDTSAENKPSVTFKSLAQMNELIELGVPENISLERFVYGLKRNR
jgi:hypothetical protein